MADFDWVTARSKCSAVSLFKELQLGVEADVEKRNGLRRNDEHTEFHFKRAGETRFSVIREADGEDSMSVDFYLDKGVINVDGATGKHVFNVGLNDQGKCVARIIEIEESTEFELWQVRRKALEYLFWPLKLVVERIGKK